MSLLVLPTPTFTQGAQSDAGAITGDFAAIVSWANGNVEHGNVGTLGFYASDIKPTSGGQATFGAGVGYTISPNAAAAVPLTLLGTAAQSADLFDVFLRPSGPQVLGINGVGAAFFTAGATTTTPLTAQGTGGQVANIFEVYQVASGTRLLGIGPGGSLINTNLQFTNTLGIVNNAGAEIRGDNAATQGIVLNVASGSTNGIRLATAGATVLQASNNGLAGSCNVGVTYAAGTFGGVAFIGTGASNGTDAIFYYNTSTQVGSISHSSTATAFNTSSDARLKENVQPLSAGGLFDRLAPVTFSWKYEGSPSGVGFLAQDLHAIVPEAVTAGSAAAPGEPGFMPWAVDFGKLVPYLVSELQALRARVATLEAK